ncbi:hypothetical protein scyTo_0000011 [Scyliorhinus torazame]|uniref:Uncharacterized protein n=1 Tax=Scyliorhinus torazame TaxID=75743 RepID=A0A401NMJ8_SCYTO|nr:hypothetical protein [Scyliorhinus torazame]
MASFDAKIFIEQEDLTRQNLISLNKEQLKATAKQVELNTQNKAKRPEELKVLTEHLGLITSPEQVEETETELHQVVLVKFHLEEQRSGLELLEKEKREEDGERERENMLSSSKGVAGTER